MACPAVMCAAQNLVFFGDKLLTNANQLNQHRGSVLEDYLSCGPVEYSVDGVAVAPNLLYTQSMLANAYFFGHPVWAENYFQTRISDKFWESRWKQVIPCWDNQIIVDIGCGSGNIYAVMGGTPALVIGVDVSPGALRMAKQVGYTPLLANAQDLPLISGFADVVTANATLHHCDDMVTVLQEAARIVKPGGLIITDFDPQSPAWDFKGLGLWANRVRRHLPLHRIGSLSVDRSATEISLRRETEIHNSKPGDGITAQVYKQILEPLGFEVSIYPHNHNVGEEVFSGHLGSKPWSTWLAQKLSGIQTTSKDSAQSLMCVARLPLNSVGVSEN